MRKSKLRGLSVFVVLLISMFTNMIIMNADEGDINAVFKIDSEKADVVIHGYTHTPTTSEPNYPESRGSIKTYTVNDVEHTMDVAPFAWGVFDMAPANLIPIRYLADAFNAQLEWNDATKVVTVTLEDGTKVDVKAAQKADHDASDQIRIYSPVLTRFWGVLSQDRVFVNVHMAAAIFDVNYYSAAEFVDGVPVAGIGRHIFETKK